MARLKTIIDGKKRSLVLMGLLLALPGAAQIRMYPDKVTSGYDSWEINAGIEGLSFHSLTKKVKNLSTNPLSSSRFTVGAALGVSKWFNPYVAANTRFSGYWGKAIISSVPEQNDIRFYSVEEHAMFNLSSIIGGPNHNRVFNFIPHVGLGFTRDCTHNDNSLGFHAGLKSTIRLGNQMGLYVDLGNHLAGNKRGASGRFYWFSMEMGLYFRIGKNKKAASTSYIYRNKKGEFSMLSLTKDIYSGGYYNNERDREDKKAELQGVKGMTLVKRGSVKMGDTDHDKLWGREVPSRTVSVDDFWMDRTEVTNGQYREFVNDVVNKIINERMKDPYFGGNRERVIESLYLTHPITGAKTLDAKQLLYVYETYDEVAAAMYEHRMNGEGQGDDLVYVTKDTAYIDSVGNLRRETVRRPLSSPYDFLNTYAVYILPDTTVWVNDFPNSDNLTYLKYYYSHKDYQNHPVVGVTWEQANAYCAWRTEKRRETLGGELGDEQPYRLPTEAEWEAAARGNSDNLFPWDKDIDRKAYAMLANFMPDDGDFTKDGNIITSKVAIYPPNTNGLYDMAGNVAEWTSTVYSVAGVEAMNNVNPQINHIYANDDPYRLKKKVVKGGSWKDPESHILSAWRVAEYQDKPRSYIGFRCVRSVATKPSERIIRISK